MEIVLATGNLHKVKEIKDILKGLDLKFLTLQDFPKMPDIVEDGKTFEENAVKKAKEIEADLISMGSYGRTGQLEQILFGSTAEKVVRGAPCPVVCVPRVKCIPERSGK